MAIISNKAEVEALQEQGKTLYHSARYPEALDAFTKAVTRCVVPKASLLDNRAASYEKLGDLHNALRDAQSTIRRHAKDVTGYLRAGRVLQKMGKPEKALQIYQYGLGKISVGCPDDYRLLSCISKKLSRQLSPPKCQDPFAVLPLELAEMILQFLSFEQAIRCLRVSKAWSKLLATSSSLWTCLDLSKAKRLVPMCFLVNTIKRSEGQLSHAILHRLGASDNRAIQLIIKSCKKLHTLEILSSHSLGNSFASLMSLNSLNVKNLIVANAAEVTLDTVCVILNTCKSLSKAEFEQVTSRNWSADWKTHLPNLRQLKLVHGNGRSDARPTGLNLPSLFPLVPNLEALTLNNWTMKDHQGGLSFRALTRLKSLNLRDCRTRYSYNDLPTSIEKLHLDDESGPYLQGADWAEMSLSLLTDLEWSKGLCGVEFLLTISSLCQGRSLERLAINESGLPETELLMLLSSRRVGRQLQELCLSNSGFNDRTAKFVVGRVPSASKCRMTTRANDCEERFPLLRRLNISRTEVTGAGVKTVVENLIGSLEYLIVRQCAFLSADAIEWAKNQGVQVVFRSQEKVVSGRKIRLDY
ncbi:MAG: hypothetical protein M1822_009900 [Bathelium mastoideum]|nr:MAG: hypothetical protein M1822_009900 [Bathelium mastoideum]